jgi:response regulator RpfG family c-di-GMP phosphodiesterase
MTTNRPYSVSMMAKDAIEEIRLNKGIYFDPDMVDVFIHSYKT